MPGYTAPALFTGLGARFLLDLFTRTEDTPTIRNVLLFGVWAGVGLQLAYKSPYLVPIGAAFAAKFFFDFLSTQNVHNFAVSIIGLVLGFTCTDFLSQYIDGPRESSERRGRKRSHTTSNGHAHIPPLSHPQQPRQRLVSFRRSVHGDTTQDTQDLLPLPLRQPVSDITSVDSTSELIGPNPSMTPLEREIATLRTRASLADTERRRFKEERKWALEQGNVARASQMKWQVKRYTALMQSFHREADAKLIEASRVRPQAAQNPALAGSSMQRQRSNGELANGTAFTSVNVKLHEPQRTRSGTLKSALRDSRS
ncbi:hypothetical protein BDN72DRAFT_956245 [Pluteus cervinus]|uniref:Uncharacterized protein n=1 Tax=Pluteus cervinus TaxID=181527 RepID=A0ACD3B7V5_9AGAR|nr:hypothetical protein BDN72DRAFT_956245 [Pluteus cervinus]